MASIMHGVAAANADSVHSRQTGHLRRVVVGGICPYQSLAAVVFVDIPPRISMPALSNPAASVIEEDEPACQCPSTRFVSRINEVDGNFFGIDRPVVFRQSDLCRHGRLRQQRRMTRRDTVRKSDLTAAMWPASVRP